MKSVQPEHGEERLHRSSIMLYCMNHAPELTGVGRYSGELHHFLVRMGYDVAVVTSPPHYPGWSVAEGYKNWYSKGRLGGADIYRCPILLGKKVAGIWRLIAPVSFAVFSAPVALAVAIQRRPKVIIATEPTLMVGVVALLAAWLVNAETVLHVQDLELDAAFATGHLKGKFVRRVAQNVERRISKKFGVIVTISDQMRRALVGRTGKDTRIEIVRNWVDTNKIKPMIGLNKYRQQVGCSSSTSLILYAGSLGAKQSLETLIDAARLLPGETYRFLIVGDGPELNRLKALSAGLNVTFLPLQPEDCMSELLSAADVHVLPQNPNIADLVLPSKLGGMLASGKAIVVVASEGTELVSFLGDAAIIVFRAEAGALAHGITLALQDTRVKKLRRLALAKALSSEIQLGKFSDVLSSIINK